LSFFFVWCLPPLCSLLLPYTTLFRSPAEVIHGALYDLVAIHHAVRVGNGSAAGGLDFFHDLQRSLAVGAFSLGAATQVVDHDLGPMLGEQQGMRPADAAAGAGYDNDLVSKTDVAHGSLLE